MISLSVLGAKVRCFYFLWNYKIMFFWLDDSLCSLFSPSAFSVSWVCKEGHSFLVSFFPLLFLYRLLKIWLLKMPLPSWRKSKPHCSPGSELQKSNRYWRCLCRVTDQRQTVVREEGGCDSLWGLLHPCRHPCTLSPGPVSLHSHKEQWGSIKPFYACIAQEVTEMKSHEILCKEFFF